MEDKEIEKSVSEVANRVYATIRTITPIYGLAFVKKENNKEYPFADFYGTSFLPKENATEREIEKACEDNNKELIATLESLEKDIISEFASEGIIKGELELDVRLVNFCGEDHEMHSKYCSNALTCETKEDALEKFKYFYAEAKMTEEEKEARRKAELDKMSEIIKVIADL